MKIWIVTSVSIVTKFHCSVTCSLAERSVFYIKCVSSFSQVICVKVCTGEMNCDIFAYSMFAFTFPPEFSVVLGSSIDVT